MNDPDPYIDVAEILAEGRTTTRKKNQRFTLKTRGKSPANLFRKEQVREAILRCIVTDTKPPRRG